MPFWTYGSPWTRASWIQGSYIQWEGTCMLLVEGQPEKLMIIYRGSDKVWGSGRSYC